MGDEKTLNLLVGLLLFLEKWGNIGAKPQLGYGIFEVTNKGVVQNNARHFWHEDMKIYEDKVDRNRKLRIDLPDLRRFGFIRYKFQPQKGRWWTQAPGLSRVATDVQSIVTNHRTIPLAPPLKNEWRFRRWIGDKSDEMWMFGSLRLRRRGETIRVRSKAAISWAYPLDNGWEMRSWVWLQDQRVAPEVWDLMQDESSWQATLGVHGQMKTDPTGAWHARTTSEVAELLEVSYES
jgi:CRISPR-associated protein Cmr1